MVTGTRRDRILFIVSLAAVHIVWGSTYLAIRYAVQTIPPFVTAGTRHTIGGMFLFAYCWSRGLRPTARHWKSAVILGILFFLIGHGALHWSEQFVASSVTALLAATMPMWVALLVAVTPPRARLSRVTIAGLAIGIAGVAFLVGRPSTPAGHRELVGMIVLLTGAISWSIGVVYSRTAPLHPSALMSAAMSLLCGGVFLLLASIIGGSAFTMTHVAPRSAIALAYLSVFGSLTFAAYTWLLTRASPVFVATHAYTNPLIAVLLGVLIAGETITPRILAAAAAILTAVVLVQRAESAAHGGGSATEATAEHADEVAQVREAGVVTRVGH